ncbi:hypothetical protein MIZ01_1003 [Sideroxyarcus emersonii]|uniref:Uncharacterized protein n=1 Tax=Sideroxyarcus emersonii TaxID=2764705 RepID=A0AAN2BYP3_9PROT|nr:hypothetical protein [Sideroxyarcus emersonii]BCK87231.1 hypothetical protein MIZ01_1003 [Sideroxyarcus emersonii]
MKIIVKARVGISNVRDLRADLLTAAYEYIEGKTGTTLILQGCKLSPNRLSEERRLFAMLAPEAAEHVSILVQDENNKIDVASGLLKDGSSQEINNISIRPKRAPGVGRHNVNNILLLNWLDGLGPQTIKSISEASGTSYPTTAAAISILADQDLLNVKKDRSISLKYFPIEQWRQWIASGFEHRKSARFIDRSGQPRPPSSLIKRLQKLGRDDIAISGIEGARFYYPDLDLSGSLRLDLVINGNHGSDLGFVKKIDPALELSNNKFHKADLVIHFLDRPKTHFKQNGELLIADPLECLADLYNMKLDQQADQMLRFLSERKKVVHA